MAFIRKKQMLKPCYADTESQFKQKQGQQQEMDKSTVSINIYLLTEKVLQQTGEQPA